MTVHVKSPKKYIHRDSHVPMVYPEARLPTRDELWQRYLGLTEVQATAFAKWQRDPTEANLAVAVAYSNDCAAALEAWLRSGESNPIGDDLDSDGDDS